MTPIVCYLKEGWLSENKKEARKIQIRVAHFVIIDDALYKRGYSLPYLRYASLEEADYVFREIRLGICGNHAGARSLVGKTLRVGYITSRPYRKTHTTSSKHVISVNAS